MNKFWMIQNVIHGLIQNNPSQKNFTFCFLISKLFSNLKEIIFVEGDFIFSRRLSSHDLCKIYFKKKKSLSYTSFFLPNPNPLAFLSLPLLGFPLFLFTGAHSFPLLLTNILSLTCVLSPSLALPPLRWQPPPVAAAVNATTAIITPTAPLPLPLTW